MKMIYGNMPVKNLNIVKHDISTNDATVMPSDLQAGVSCYARGQKIVGTGKAFEFAEYGVTTTNVQGFVPALINVVEITSLEYPIKGLTHLLDMSNIDFTTEQTIGIVVIDNVEYPITIKIEGYILTFNCEKTVTLDYFYGKDNYV